jgi:hypothetical protein
VAKFDIYVDSDPIWTAIPAGEDIKDHFPSAFSKDHFLITVENETVPRGPWICLMDEMDPTEIIRIIPQLQQRELNTHAEQAAQILRQKEA